MIKECKVILCNQAVTVVLFDGVEVQLPSVKQVTSTAYVKLENDNYTIVSKEEYEASKKPIIRRKEKAKVFSEETLEEIKVESEEE